MINPSTGESGRSQKATIGEVTNYGKYLGVTKELPIESDLNGYIAWRIDLYEQIFRYRDYDLWECYVEDFEVLGDHLPTCKQGIRANLRKLRDFLCICRFFIVTLNTYSGKNVEGTVFEKFSVVCAVPDSDRFRNLPISRPDRYVQSMRDYK
jgi:hypothetical protein